MPVRERSPVAGSAQSPIIPQACRQYAAIFQSSSYIVTARELESTAVVINHHSQLPSRSIDTDVDIEGFVIFGNALFVASSEKVVHRKEIGEWTIYNKPTG